MATKNESQTRLRSSFSPRAEASVYNFAPQNVPKGDVFGVQIDLEVENVPKGDVFESRGN